MRDALNETRDIDELEGSTYTYIISILVGFLPIITSVRLNANVICPANEYVGGLRLQAAAFMGE